MKYFPVFLLACVFFLSSCGTDTEQGCAFVPETSGIPVNISFTSLSDSLAGVSSKQELVSLLNRHEILREIFFKRSQYPNDSAFINELYRRFTNIHFDTLALEVKRVFGDEAQLKSDLTQAFKNLKYYYPEIQAPRIETVISGFETDMYVSDSLIIIGLDYYLGKGAKFRPNMYEYMLLQYNPENIVASIMLIYGIDPRINHMEGNNKTALADMVAYGKSFYFAKQMIPCMPDSVFIWYSAAEIKGAWENQDLIWARIIEDKLLYSTNHVLKQQYLGDRPKTTQVGTECPGRIAQWVGWQIVKSYMKEHPDRTLPQLMNSGNADKLFEESKYKPRRR
ncbi:MAG TPA: gliding motility lipoprotein GldB [Cyclobacteriaceae bacterium]|nr:gliding motility lipoprotein GldB [Cyclobacteriaceae bacterium]